MSLLPDDTSIKHITSQKIHSLPDKKTKPNQPNHNLPNKTNMKQYWKL